ncbi:MAG: hypothetical protein AB1814_05250 [Thermodesulfobacteriota bacterium]
MPRRCLLLILAALCLAASGCMHLSRVEPGARPALYQAQGPAPELVRRFAPAFLVNNFHQQHNRIGRPVASRDQAGQEVIRMDPSRPAVYWRVANFQTPRGRYTNLIYRVHFPSTPASLIPFFIGAGDNMGLLVVVTLDQASRPVLVTTLGTCGCYAASQPTNYTPRPAYPADWNGQPVSVYGETLPPRLDYAGPADQALLVVIRPGEHRVMDLRVLPRNKLNDTGAFQLIPAELLPVASLRRLPLGKGFTSLFYEDGLFKGHVKGSWKPWETFLLGWLSLDWVVGMDKVYGDPDNPLYTSLKPWNRYRSNLADFPQFLKYWGWGL